MEYQDSSTHTRKKSSSSHRPPQSKLGSYAFSLERGSNSYGIQPLGNMLLQCTCNVRDSGLGTLKVFSDEMLCDILGLLGAVDLARLAFVSKALYVFCCQDFLWRNLVLLDFQGRFSFEGCWKSTYAVCRAPSSYRAHVPLKVSGFFSDYLFQSWLCANLRMRAEWLSRDNVDRRSNLSVEEFIRNYEDPKKPVVITDAMANWAALKRYGQGRATFISI
eukprot:c12961_g1_i2 orf=1126-1782(-)